MASRDSATLIEEFTVERPPTAELSPDFNVAPSKDVYVVAERAERGEEGVQRELALARWGLVPSWAKDPKIGYRMINARTETVAEKPAYRSAFGRRRCLVPADGYYEWHTPTGVDAPKSRTGKPLKQPFYIHPSDQSVFAMAGLYEFWHDRRKDLDDPNSWLRTTTILTSEASESLRIIHDRMPLAVPPELWSDWLNPNLPNPQDLRAVLTSLSASAPTAWLQAEPVGTAVNSVRNNGPGLVQPLPSG